MKTLDKESQSQITPAKALELLKNGNKRFLDMRMHDRDLLSQVEMTSSGQFPFAAILGCIDSRVPTEIVFDQGFGDIFSVRVAGNIVNEDVLGSLEYSCKVAGAKIIVVLGHSHCGAVTAACNDVKLGNISALLEKIKPAVNTLNLKVYTDEDVDKVAIANIKNSIEEIKRRSSILHNMEENGEIILAGAMYDVSSGKVNFI